MEKSCHGSWVKRDLLPTLKPLSGRTRTRIAFAVPGSLREEEDEVPARPVGWSQIDGDKLQSGRALKQQNQITLSLAVEPRGDH